MNSASLRQNSNLIDTSRTVQNREQILHEVGSRADIQQYLSSENLVTRKELRYYRIMAIISAIAWFLSIFTVVVPIFLGLTALLVWFATGLLVAWLRSESIKISKEQAPILFRTFQSVCERLNIHTLPDIYVVESGGALNAFVTRHFGRDFVVVFSDAIDAYGMDSAEIRFIIGHELGHIRRKHLRKSLFLLPAKIIPLLREAYSRACESTCDRFGAFAAQDFEASKRALMILSGGKILGKTANTRAFLSQHRKDRGFFVSLHELLSGYPTMSQRVLNIAELHEGREPRRASRSFIAYPVGFFLSLGRRAIILYVIALISIGIVTHFGKKSDESKRQAKTTQLESLLASSSTDKDAHSDDTLLEWDIAEDE